MNASHATVILYCVRKSIVLPNYRDDNSLVYKNDCDSQNIKYINRLKNRL
jgi:hypothetical protein